MRLASFETKRPARLRHRRRRRHRRRVGAPCRASRAACAKRLAAGALRELERLASVGSPISRCDDVAFAPVIPDAAAKLLCVGINYLPHIKEMGRERPERPVLFVRFGDSVVGHGQPLLKPRESEQFDYEGELAVVIGKRARRVSQRTRARLRRGL